jgi:hypothetical protein
LIRSRIETGQVGSTWACSRLEEWAQLERLVEKVGRIDPHTFGGQGFDALLAKLVRLTSPETE